MSFDDIEPEVSLQKIRGLEEDYKKMKLALMADLNNESNGNGAENTLDVDNDPSMGPGLSPCGPEIPAKLFARHASLDVGITKPAVKSHDTLESIFGTSVDQQKSPVTRSDDDEYLRVEVDEVDKHLHKQNPPPTHNVVADEPFPGVLSPDLELSTAASGERRASTSSNWGDSTTVYTIREEPEEEEAGVSPMAADGVSRLRSRSKSLMVTGGRLEPCSVDRTFSMASGKVDELL